MSTVNFSFVQEILLLSFIIATGCNKLDAPNPKNDPANKTFELPFENSNLKMELISTSIPGGSYVNDVHFFNETTGVIITYNGKIFKTSNSGVSWSLQYENTSNNQALLQILFMDQKVGYVAGGDENNYPGHTSRGVILKTSDGGETWTTVFQITGSIKFNSIAKDNKNNLLVIGNANTQKSDKIFKSTDGGITWITSDYKDFKLSKITFTSKFGYCTGGAHPGTGKIYRSTDNGNSWSEAKSFADTDWTWDLAFKDSIGYCIGNNQSIYKTGDFGESWVLVHSGTSYKIDLLTYSSCLIWGGGGWSGYETGAFRQTTNGGKDWIDYTFKKDVGALRCSSFYSTTEGYVVAGSYLIKVRVK